MKRAERPLYPLRRTKDEDRAPADDALAFTARQQSLRPTENAYFYYIFYYIVGTREQRRRHVRLIRVDLRQ